MLPEGHLPIALRWVNGAAQVDWCFVGADRFTEPFFDNTISRHMQRPYNRAMRPLTGVDALQDLVASGAVVAPSAFIFHLSRCGSTLLKQMFSADPATLVISEALPIDQVLRTCPPDEADADDQFLSLLRSLILSLGRRRGVAITNYLIKFDPFHTRHIGLIERAFPAVPRVFLYRDPLEVLVSNLKQPAALTIPGVLYQGVEAIADSALPLSPEQYTARVIANHAQQALKHAFSDGALFINYEDLPLRALAAICAHFAMSPAPEVTAAMHAVARLDAKKGAVVFVADGEEKRRMASDEARYWSDTLLLPLYEKLEALRWRP